MSLTRVRKKKHTPELAESCPCGGCTVLQLSDSSLGCWIGKYQSCLQVDSIPTKGADKQDISGLIHHLPLQSYTRETRCRKKSSVPNPTELFAFSQPAHGDWDPVPQHNTAWLWQRTPPAEVQLTDFINMLPPFHTSHRAQL